jgi:hypothetical protein
MEPVQDSFGFLIKGFWVDVSRVQTAFEATQFIYQNATGYKHRDLGRALKEGFVPLNKRLSRFDL